MKLLEITRSFYPNVGGLENFIYERTKIYEALDIKYSIISTNISTSKVHNSPIPENHIVLNQYTPYNITPGIRKYLNTDFDILSSNLLGRYYSDFSIRYSKKKGKKTILTPHFSFHTRNHTYLKKIHKQFIAPNILKYVDKIICLTQVEKDFWIENYKINEDKIAVIPHYIELRNVDTSFSISSSHPYLFYLGRYDGNKRIDLLLDAFDQLQNSNLNLYLTVNRNELPSNLLSIVDRNSKIQLLGFITETEKWDYINNCQGIIFPSEYEAFGHVC